MASLCQHTLGSPQKKSTFSNARKEAGDASVTGYVEKAVQPPGRPTHRVRGYGGCFTGSSPQKEIESRARHAYASARVRACHPVSCISARPHSVNLVPMSSMTFRSCCMSLLCRLAHRKSSFGATVFSYCAQYLAYSSFLLCSSSSVFNAFKHSKTAR